MMTPIARDIRYGLPNQTYLKFVNTSILVRTPEQALVDPFALDVWSDQSDGPYVERPEVEAEVIQFGNKLISGPTGSGKTTLFRKWVRLLRARQTEEKKRQTTEKLSDEQKLEASSVETDPLPHHQALIVSLPLPQVVTSMDEIEIMAGRLSPLCPTILSRFIFRTFWKEMIDHFTGWAGLWVELRQNPQWLNRLRWFYQKYRPLYLSPEITRDFLLMTWLDGPSGEPFGPDPNPQEILRETVALVTSTNSPQLYREIQLLIDGTEILSDNAIPLLLQDLQKLYDLYLGRVHFQLFSDSAWQTQLEEMVCVRQSRVSIYQLPKWDIEQLMQLLQRRLIGSRPGEVAESGGWNDLSPTYIKLKARSNISQIISNAALEAYKRDDPLDTPIHALRLARGLIAALAGCWEAQGFKTPLEIHHLDELINFYWEVK